MTSFTEQVNNAIAAHGQWKLRLRDAIAKGSSEHEVVTVAQDNQCAFGKWLYGDSWTSFPSPDDHRKVRDLHAEFHKEAARVLGLAVSGHGREADAAMAPGSPFARVSSNLVTTLMRLRPAA